MGLDTINVFYDYIYSPIKKHLHNKTNKPNNHEDILNILNLIEDINIYNDLHFCLENKDNKNEKYNIEMIIQKYNKNINTNITSICNYFINYFNNVNNTNTLDSNKIYYIDL